MQPSLRNLTAVFLTLGLALAQAAGPFDFNSIPRPPVPADLLELVTGSAQTVQDAQQRIAALAMLDQAHQLSNVRAQPYDLKTSFTASGGLASDGSWTLEDISPGRGYRWTANGPNYSAVNLYPQSTTAGLYGNQPSGILPLRLLQVRSAMFFIFPMVGPQASVRTASGSLNGAPQNCVLVVIGAGSRAFTGGRNWEESEYCVDAQTGLLSQYSPAPGLFVRYDYSSAIRFHNKFIPTSFTISENGQTVAEARTLSVSDPPPAADPMFTPTGLMPLGSGRAMNPGTNFAIPVFLPGQRPPASSANAAMQVVTMHGNLAGDGHLNEPEVLASSDSTLNQAAIKQAESVFKARAQNQPGATAQSSELILTFEFITPAQ
jgi:hypothetical protein